MNEKWLLYGAVALVAYVLIRGNGSVLSNLGGGLLQPVPTAEPIDPSGSYPIPWDPSLTDIRARQGGFI